jgi:hypothetical protein
MHNIKINTLYSLPRLRPLWRSGHGERPVCVGFVVLYERFFVVLHDRFFVVLYDRFFVVLYDRFFSEHFAFSLSFYESYKYIFLKPPPLIILAIDMVFQFTRLLSLSACFQYYFLP